MKLNTTLTAKHTELFERACLISAKILLPFVNQALEKCLKIILWS